MDEVIETAEQPTVEVSAPPTEMYCTWGGCMTPPEQHCTMCSRCEVHCSCKQCSECSEKVLFALWCRNCDRCRRADGCCKCASCISCGSRRRPEEICTLCNRGECCCNCITCQTCSIRVCRQDACYNCRHCKEHCACITCESCQELRAPANFCSLCGRSTDCCCECRDCRRCGVRVRETCRNCVNRCEICCRHSAGCRQIWASGNDYRTIPFQKQPLQFHTAKRSELKINPLMRYLSAEIEVDEFLNISRSPMLKEAVTKWQDTVVTDGSLSNTNAHEVNTQPSSGDKFLEHISDLTNAYSAMGASCSSSCGLHVHVDAAPCQNRGERSIHHNPESCPRCRYQFTYYDLRKVIALYAKTERSIFELVGRQRLHNRFAAICGRSWLCSSKEPKMFRRELIGKLYNKTEDGTPMPKGGDYNVRDRKRNKYQPIRYRALNVHSYFLRGTIEFRHHEGSVDYEEITNWAMFCGNLVQAAVLLSETDIAALPSEREGLRVVMPHSLQPWIERKWGTYYYDLNSRTTANQIWSDIDRGIKVEPIDPDDEERDDNPIGVCSCGDPDCGDSDYEE